MWSDDLFASANSETYLDMVFNLWKKDSSVKNNELCPGNHEFPFEFPLPPNIPSSFKDMKGQVEYTCTAWMPSSGMFGKDYGLGVVIPVCRKVTLPAISLHDCRFTEREVAGGLFKFSGKIKLTVELPRTGYLVGEVVPLSGNIVNESRSSIQLCAYLIQHVSYTNPRHPQVKRQAHYSRLSVTIGKFSGSQNTPWSSDKLCIPEDLPPSGATDGCQFFAISYSIKVVMIGSGTTTNSSATYDIIVGNDLGVPRSESAHSTLNAETEWHEQLQIINTATSTLGGESNRVGPIPEARSVNLLLPKPAILHVSAANTDTTMQPPSYYELFPQEIPICDCRVILSMTS